jgi:hypothetical protein
VLIIAIASANSGGKKNTASSTTTHSSSTAATSSAAATTAPATTTAAPASTPATSQPAPLAQPQTWAGTTDGVAKFRAALTSDDSRYLTITGNAQSNFVVEELDTSGQTADLLVNTIGAYSGDLMLIPDTTIVALKVTSDGPWSIKAADVRTAPQWNGKTRLAAHGDNAYIIPGGLDALTTVNVTNVGQDNFVIYETDDTGRNLLVNEIGSYHGTQALPQGTVAVEVQAGAGSWSITPTG